MSVTRNIGKYINESCINLSELARKAGVTYSALYASVGKYDSEREFRADELVAICGILGINPMDFRDEPTEETEEVGA